MKITQDLLSSMKGKTIEKVMHPGVNCLIIQFSDGTEVDFEVEHVGHGLYAISLVDPPIK